MTGYHRDMKQDVRIASAFVQNEWKMNQFVFLAGFRLDDHNLIDNPIFSPRLNLLYKPVTNYRRASLGPPVSVRRRLMMKTCTLRQ